MENLFDFLEIQNEEDIIKLENDLPAAVREQAVQQLNDALRQLQKQKVDAGLQEQANYIDTKIPKAKEL